jgi:acetoin utilization protein AcuC
LKKAFIYSDEFTKYDYGPSHPLKTIRLKLTYELISAYGLFSLPGSILCEPEKASDEELIMFHEKEYIEMLKSVNNGVPAPGMEKFGLGPGDNPVFKGLLDWSRTVAGASLKAADLVGGGETGIAFNISGGLHHAMPARAYGFCYINDPVLTIMSLLKKYRKVAYIDIDAHHGDGVQEAFIESDKVLTFSIHETGKMLFPGTGFETELGTKKGEGYSVNIPMPPYSDDELLVYAFSEIVPPLLDKFNPDIVVTQLGVDSFIRDPLAHLSYTTNGFCQVLNIILGIAPKWVALGGGGYDIANVARAWTLAWSVMNNVDIPDKIPDTFLTEYSEYGFASGRLRDEAYTETGPGKDMARREVDRLIGYLKDRVLGE